MTRTRIFSINITSVLLPLTCTFYACDQNMRHLPIYLLKKTLGILTLKMRLRWHVQFVAELAPVKIAWQVNTETVKVRSDIKDGCFNATTVFL